MSILYICEGGTPRCSIPLRLCHAVLYRAPLAGVALSGLRALYRSGDIPGTRYDPSLLYSHAVETPGPRVTYCVQTVVGTKRQVCAWPCKYHTILNNMMCKALCKKTYLLSCVISTPWTLLDAMRSCGPSEGTSLVLTFRKAICGCPAPCDQSLRMLSRFVKEKRLVLSCSNFKGMPE